MAGVAVSFLISTGGSLAQAVLDLFSQPSGNENFNEQIIRCNPGDNVFEEFDNSEGWKEKRGSLWRAVVRSLWISLQMVFLSALCVGPGAVFIIVVEIVIASKSHLINHMRYAVETYLLHFWHPLLLLNIFLAQFLRGIDVFSKALVGALLHVSIHFYIQDVFEWPWNSLLENFVYGTVIVVNSFSIGREFFPQGNKEAVKMAFKFSAQFILGGSALHLAWYTFYSASANQNTMSRLIHLGLAMLTAFPVKVISRCCALSLEGINHPGNSFILVSAIYGGSIILFRNLQAEIESFETFIGLSLVHGVFQLIEVLMIKVEGVLVGKLRQCCGNKRKFTEEYVYIAEAGGELGDESVQLEVSSADQHKRAHARLQRFLADTIIQGMLFEPATIVISVSLIELYGIINAISIEETSTMAAELIKRIYAGVFIEFGFNVCCVLILTRYMNIPILRVWKIRWKSHVTVFVITTVMSLLFYTDFVIRIVKGILTAEGLLSVPVAGKGTQVPI